MMDSNSKSLPQLKLDKLEPLEQQIQELQNLRTRYGSPISLSYRGPNPPRKMLINIKGNIKGLFLKQESENKLKPFMKLKKQAIQQKISKVSEDNVAIESLLFSGEPGEEVSLPPLHKRAKSFQTSLQLSEIKPMTIQSSMRIGEELEYNPDHGDQQERLIFEQGEDEQIEDRHPQSSREGYNSKASKSKQVISNINDKSSQEHLIKKQEPKASTNRQQEDIVGGHKKALSLHIEATGINVYNNYAQQQQTQQQKQGGQQKKNQAQQSDEASSWYNKEISQTTKSNKDIKLPQMKAGNGSQRQLNILGEGQSISSQQQQQSMQQSGTEFASLRQKQLYLEQKNIDEEKEHSRVKSLMVNGSGVEIAKNRNVQESLEVLNKIKEEADRKKREELQFEGKPRLEKYDEYQLSDPNFQELLRNGPVHAVTRLQNMKQDETVWVDCLVEEYDSKKQAFRVKWLNENVMREKWVNRMNLMFDFDEEEEMERRKRLALERKNLNEYFQDLNLLVDVMREKVKLNLPEDVFEKIANSAFSHAGVKNHNKEKHNQRVGVNKHQFLMNSAATSTLTSPRNMHGQQFQQQLAFKKVPKQQQVSKMAQSQLNFQQFVNNSDLLLSNSATNQAYQSQSFNSAQQSSQQYLQFIQSIGQKPTQLHGGFGQHGINREEVIKEVRDLYVYMALRFMLEFEKVKDVELFYENFLPMLSAKHFVDRIPLSGVTQFNCTEIVMLRSDSTEKLKDVKRGIVQLYWGNRCIKDIPKLNNGSLIGSSKNLPIQDSIKNAVSEGNDPILINAEVNQQSKQQQQSSSRSINSVSLIQLNQSYGSAESNQNLKYSKKMNLQEAAAMIITSVSENKGLVTYNFHGDEGTEKQTVEQIFRASHVNYGMYPENNTSKQFLFNQFKVQICIGKPHIADRKSFRRESYINEITPALAKEIAVYGGPFGVGQSIREGESPNNAALMLQKQVVRRVTMMAAFIKQVEDIRIFKAFFLRPVLQQQQQGPKKSESQPQQGGSSSNVNNSGGNGNISNTSNSSKNIFLQTHHQNIISVLLPIDESSMKKYFRDRYTREVNKMDSVVYKVEKGIYEILDDFSETVSGHKQKLIDIANQLLLSSIKFCLQKSVQDYVEQLRECFCSLPLPQISLKVARSMPERVYRTRQSSLIRLLLPSDDFSEPSEEQLLPLAQNNNNSTTDVIEGTGGGEEGDSQTKEGVGEEQQPNIKINSGGKSAVNPNSSKAELFLPLPYLQQELQQQQQQLAGTDMVGICGPSIQGFATYRSHAQQDQTIVNKLCQYLMHSFLIDKKRKNELYMPFNQWQLQQQQASTELFPQAKPEFLLQRLPSFAKFEVELVINPMYRRLKLKPHERKQALEQGRKNFYERYKSFQFISTKKVINVELKEDDMAGGGGGPGGSEDSTSSTDFQSTTRFRLGQHLQTGKLFFGSSPDMYQIEKMLKLSFLAPLTKVEKLPMVNACLAAEVFKLPEHAALCRSLVTQIDEFLPWMLYAMLAMITILEQMSFLLVQSKTFIPDLQQEFMQNEDPQILTYEMQLLKRDLEFFTERMPEALNCGVIVLKDYLDLNIIYGLNQLALVPNIQRCTVVKQQFVSQIQQYISEIERIVVEQITKVQEDTEKQILAMQERMGRIPQTLREFVDFSNFINSTDIDNFYESVQLDVVYISELMKTIEEFRILEHPSEVLARYLQSKYWLKNLRAKEQTQRKQLETVKNKFRREVDSMRVSVFEQFAQLCQEKTDKVHGQADLSQAFAVNSVVQTLKESLHSAFAQAEEINFFEGYLGTVGAPIMRTDFTKIGQQLEDLMKYVELWDYAERWKFHHEQWTDHPLSQVEPKEVVDMIHEGFQLLPLLRKEFQDQLSFVAMIDQLEQEISDFNSNVHIIVPLRDPGFKQRYWDVLIEEICKKKGAELQLVVADQQEGQLQQVAGQSTQVPGQSTQVVGQPTQVGGQPVEQSNDNEQQPLQPLFKKPDMNTVTLNELLNKYGINDHIALIYRLFKVAKEDYQIELELNRIEISLKELSVDMVHQYMYEMEGQITFNIVKNHAHIARVAREAKIRTQILTSSRGFVEMFRKRVQTLGKLTFLVKKVFSTLFKIQACMVKYAPLLCFSSSSINGSNNSSLLPPDTMKLFQEIQGEFNYYCAIIGSHNANIFSMFIDSLTHNDKSVLTSDKLREDMRGTLALCEKLRQKIYELVRGLRKASPRFFFLSSDKIIELFTVQKLVPRSALARFLICFQGVKECIISRTSGGDGGEKQGKKGRKKGGVGVQRSRINGETNAGKKNKNDAGDTSTKNPEEENDQGGALASGGEDNEDLWGSESFADKAALQFQIDGVRNWAGEELMLHEAIEFRLHPDSLSQLFQNIEESMQDTIRSQLGKTLTALVKFNYDYLKIWHYLQTNSDVLFQVVYLAVDVIFYHDLTCILMYIEQYENEQVVLDYLEVFQENFKAFVQSFSRSQHGGGGGGGGGKGEHHGTQQQQNQVSLDRGRTSYQHFSQLAMLLLYHQSVLKKYMDFQVDTLASFEYLALPKFSMETSKANFRIPPSELQKSVSAQVKQAIQINQTELDLPKFCHISEFFKRFTADVDLSILDQQNPQQQLSQNQNKSANPLQSQLSANMVISMIALNYKQTYSCELVESCGHFALTEASQRAFFHALAAFSTNQALLVRSTPCVGKMETFKTLARILAKPCFLWQSTMQAGGSESIAMEMQGMHAQVLGTALGGYWLLLENFEQLCVSQMKVLADILYQLRSAQAAEKRIVFFQGMQLELRPPIGSGAGDQGWGICLSQSLWPSVSVGSQQHQTLPNSLLENVRIYNFLQPDSVAILSSFFHVNNFVQPDESARRLVFFFQMLANSAIENLTALQQHSIANIGAGCNGEDGSSGLINHDDNYYHEVFGYQEKTYLQLFNPNYLTMSQIMKALVKQLYEGSVSNDSIKQNHKLIYNAIVGIYHNMIDDIRLRSVKRLFRQVFLDENVATNSNDLHQSKDLTSNNSHNTGSELDSNDDDDEDGSKSSESNGEAENQEKTQQQQQGKQAHQAQQQVGGENLKSRTSTMGSVQRQRTRPGGGGGSRASYLQQLKGGRPSLLLIAPEPRLGGGGRRSMVDAEEPPNSMLQKQLQLAEEVVASYFKTKHNLRISNTYCKKISELVQLSRQWKQDILLLGDSKDLIIAAAAHASSVVLKANFFKHFVCLDANDYEYLLGFYDKSNHNDWQPGIIQQLIEQINYCEELILHHPQLADNSLLLAPLPSLQQPQMQQLLSPTSSAQNTQQQFFATNGSNFGTVAQQQQQQATQVQQQQPVVLTHQQKKQKAENFFDCSIFESQIAYDDNKADRRFSMRDWLVLEASTLNNYVPYNHQLELILGSAERRRFCMDNGYTLAIPAPMRIVAMLDHLHNLSPGLVTRFTTYIFDTTISLDSTGGQQPQQQQASQGALGSKSCYGSGCGFKADDYFMAFLQQLLEKNEFFAMTEKPLRMCFTFLFEETINFMQTKLDQRHDLLHGFSQALYLKNFLKMLQILLNEFRKTQIAFGNYNVQFSSRAKDIKSAAFYASISIHKRNKHLEQLKKHQLQELQSANQEEGASLHQQQQQQQKENNNGSASNNNQAQGAAGNINVIANIKMEDQKKLELSIASQVQALFAFCLIWTVGKDIVPEKHRAFTHFFLDCLNHLQNESQELYGPEFYSAAQGLSQCLGQSGVNRLHSVAEEEEDEQGDEEEDGASISASEKESQRQISINGEEPLLLNRQSSSVRLLGRTLGNGGRLAAVQDKRGQRKKPVNVDTHHQQLAQQQCSLFDLYYDISRERWQHLEEMTVDHDALGLMDTDLSNNYFDIREIVRLNPEVLEIREIQKHVGSDLDQKVMSIGQNYFNSGNEGDAVASGGGAGNSRNFIHFTQPLKIIKYFMDLFINYQCNIMLVSSAQAGKTRLLQYQLGAALQRNLVKVSTTSVAPHTRITDFQRLVEGQFQKKSDNILISEIGKPCYVFVDDLNLAATGPSPVGAIRALAKYGGWFSQSRNMYLHFDRTQLGCAFTYGGGNSLQQNSTCQKRRFLLSNDTGAKKLGEQDDMRHQTQDMFQLEYSNLPESMVEHFVVLDLPDLNSQHLTSIFTEIIQQELINFAQTHPTLLYGSSSLISEQSGIEQRALLVLADRIQWNLASLATVYYHLSPSLDSIRMKYQLNLGSVDKVIQFARALVQLQVSQFEKQLSDKKEEPQQQQQFFFTAQEDNDNKAAGTIKMEPLFEQIAFLANLMFSNELPWSQQPNASLKDCWMDLSDFIQDSITGEGVGGVEGSESESAFGGSSRQIGLTKQAANNNSNSGGGQLYYLLKPPTGVGNSTDRQEGSSIDSEDNFVGRVRTRTYSRSGPDETGNSKDAVKQGLQSSKQQAASSSQQQMPEIRNFKNLHQRLQDLCDDVEQRLFFSQSDYHSEGQEQNPQISASSSSQRWNTLGIRTDDFEELHSKFIKIFILAMASSNRRSTSDEGSESAASLVKMQQQLQPIFSNLQKQRSVILNLKFSSFIADSIQLNQRILVLDSLMRHSTAVAPASQASPSSQQLIQKQSSHPSSSNKKPKSNKSITNDSQISINNAEEPVAEPVQVLEQQSSSTPQQQQEQNEVKKKDFQININKVSEQLGKVENDPRDRSRSSSRQGRRLSAREQQLSFLQIFQDKLLNYLHTDLSQYFNLNLIKGSSLELFKHVLSLVQTLHFAPFSNVLLLSAQQPSYPNALARFVAHFLEYAYTDYTLQGYASFQILVSNVISQLIAQPKNRKLVLFIQARDDAHNEELLQSLSLMQALFSGSDLLPLLGVKQLQKFAGELKQSMATEKLLSGVVATESAAHQTMDLQQQQSQVMHQSSSINPNVNQAQLLMQQQLQLSDSHYQYLLTQLIQNNLKLVVCFQMQSYEHRLQLCAAFPKFFRSFTTLFLFQHDLFQLPTSIPQNSQPLTQQPDAHESKQHDNNPQIQQVSVELPARQELHKQFEEFFAFEMDVHNVYESAHCASLLRCFEESYVLMHGVRERVLQHLQKLRPQGQLSAIDLKEVVEDKLFELSQQLNQLKNDLEDKEALKRQQVQEISVLKGAIFQLEKQVQQQPQQQVQPQQVQGASQNTLTSAQQLEAQRKVLSALEMKKEILSTTIQEASKDYDDHKKQLFNISRSINELISSVHFVKQHCVPLMQFVDEAQLDCLAAYIAAYIVGCMKYEGRFREVLQRGAEKIFMQQIPLPVSITRTGLHHYIAGSTAFLYDSMLCRAPLSASLIDNIAILELIYQLDLLHICVNDPAHLFLAFIKSRYPSKIVMEMYSVNDETNEIIESAVTGGYTLVVYNPDHQLQDKLEPIVQQKFRKMVSRLIGSLQLEQTFSSLISNLNASAEQEGNSQQSNTQQSKPFSTAAKNNSNDDVVVLNGKAVKVHQKFRLVVMTTEQGDALSRVGGEGAARTAYSEAIIGSLFNAQQQNSGKPSNTSQQTRNIRKQLIDRMFSCDLQLSAKADVCMCIVDSLVNNLHFDQKKKLVQAHTRKLEQFQNMNFTSAYLQEVIHRFDLMNPQTYTSLDSYLIKNYKELTVEELFPEMFKMLEEEEKDKMNQALEKLMKFENAVSGSGEDGEAEGNDIVVKKSNEGPSSATAIDQPGKQQNDQSSQQNKTQESEDQEETANPLAKRKSRLEQGEESIQQQSNEDRKPSTQQQGDIVIRERENTQLELTEEEKNRHELEKLKQYQQLIQEEIRRTKELRLRKEILVKEDQYFIMNFEPTDGQSEGDLHPAYEIPNLSRIGMKYKNVIEIVYCLWLALRQLGQMDSNLDGLSNAAFSQQYFFASLSFALDSFSKGSEISTVYNIFSEEDFERQKAEMVRIFFQKIVAGLTRHQLTLLRVQMSKIYLRSFSKDVDTLWQFLLSFEVPRPATDLALFFEAERSINLFEHTKTQLQQIFQTSEYCLAPVLLAPSAAPPKKISKQTFQTFTQIMTLRSKAKKLAEQSRTRLLKLKETSSPIDSANGESPKKTLDKFSGTLKPSRVGPSLTEDKSQQIPTTTATINDQKTTEEVKVPTQQDNEEDKSPQLSQEATEIKQMYYQQIYEQQEKRRGQNKKLSIFAQTKRLEIKPVQLDEQSTAGPLLQQQPQPQQTGEKLTTEFSTSELNGSLIQFTPNAASGEQSGSSLMQQQLRKKVVVALAKQINYDTPRHQNAMSLQLTFQVSVLPSKFLTDTFKTQIDISKLQFFSELLDIPLQLKKGTGTHGKISLIDSLILKTINDASDIQQRAADQLLRKERQQQQQNKQNGSNSPVKHGNANFPSNANEAPVFRIQLRQRQVIANSFHEESKLNYEADFAYVESPSPKPRRGGDSATKNQAKSGSTVDVSRRCREAFIFNPITEENSRNLWLSALVCDSMKKLATFTKRPVLMDILKHMHNNPYFWQHIINAPLFYFIDRIEMGQPMMPSLSAKQTKGQKPLSLAGSFRLAVISASDQNKAQKVNQGGQKSPGRTQDANQIYQSFPVLDTTLLFKFIRPDFMEKVLDNMISTTLSPVFVQLPKTQFGSVVRSSRLPDDQFLTMPRPTVIYFDPNITYNLMDILELQASRIDEKIEIKRVVLGSTSSVSSSKVLGGNADPIVSEVNDVLTHVTQAEQKGNWVVVDNLSLTTSRQQRLFIKGFSQQFLYKQKSNLDSQSISQSHFRVFFLHQLGGERTHISSKNDAGDSKLLLQFYSPFWKYIFVVPDSVKQTMTMLFNNELHEYITSIERKNKLQLGAYNFSFAGKMLRPQQYEFGKFRLLQLKRHDVVNLHSLVNRTELSHQIERQVISLKFNSLFFISVLRLKQHFISSSYSSGSGLVNGGSSISLYQLSDSDLLWMLEDVLFFLHYFPINPSNFIKAYFAYMFTQQPQIQQGLFDTVVFNNLILDPMLNEFALQGLDNQTIVEVGGGDYTNNIEQAGGNIEGIPDKIVYYNLYQEQMDISNEENLFRTISLLPNSDPLELLGLSLNQEIQLNYQKSLRLLNFLSRNRHVDVDFINSFLAKLVPQHFPVQNVQNTDVGTPSSIKGNTKAGFSSPSSHLNTNNRRGPPPLTSDQISQKIANVVQIFALHTLERRNQQKVQLMLLKTIVESLPTCYNLLDDVTMFKKIKNRSSKIQSSGNEATDRYRLWIQLIPYKDNQKGKGKGRRGMLISTNTATPNQSGGTQTGSSNGSILGASGQGGGSQTNQMSNYFKASTNQQRRRSSALSIMLHSDNPLARKLKMQAMAVPEEMSPLPQIKDKLDLFKVLIINELLTMNDVLRTILTDIDCMVMYVEQEKFDLFRNVVQLHLQQLSDQQIPDNWIRHSFWQCSSSLLDFLKSLLSKIEFLENIISLKDFKIKPIIQFNKLLNPFVLLSNMLWQASTQKKIPISELKFMFDLDVKPEDQQLSQDQGVVVSGLILKNAKFNTKYLILEEENIRELQQVFPPAKLIILKKTYKNNLFLFSDPSVSFQVKDDAVYDIEGEYNEQIQTLIGMKSLKKNVMEKKKRQQERILIQDQTYQDKKLYYVRIPVINPRTSHIYSFFPMKIFFYFKSYMPQEFWIRREAKVFMI